MNSPLLKKHPLLGNTPAFAKDTLGFVQRCMQEHTDIVKTKIAFRDFYFLLSPEAIHHVLQKNHKNYKKSFAYKGMADFLGNGLLTSEGEKWLQQRRTVQPAFHREIIGALEDQMRTAIVEVIQNKLIGKGPVNIQLVCMELAGRIISESIFGPQVLGEENAKIIQEALPVLRKFANDKLKNPFMLPLWVPSAYNKNYLSAKRDLFEIMKLAVENHVDEHSSTLLGMLLSLKDPEDNSTLTTEAIVELITTIYIAGQETTSNALVFALHALATHPEYMLELVGRVDANESQVLQPFVNEVLRLYPPAWAVSREAIDTDTVCGMTIPKGATVFLSIYAMHHHKDYWEDPKRFNPNRFIDKEPNKAFLPFGKGPRICIGDNFALLELTTALGEILKRTTLNLHSSAELRLITPMTLNTKDPVIMSFEGRSLNSK